MPEHQSQLAPLYKGWDAYQQHLVTAIAPLTPEQLAAQAAPHLRSIGAIATHVIGARARWLHYVLREGGDDLVGIGTWDDPGQPARTAAELAQALETTWQVLQAALERWTVADLDTTLYDTDENGVEERFTRQWVIWHLIEHDLHHGGELSFSLGMQRLAAIDL